MAVFRRAALACAFLLVATGASAAPLTLSNFGGGWSNATVESGGCVSIDNNAGSSADDARWRGRGLFLGFIPTCSAALISYSSSNTSGYVFDPTNSSYTFPGSPTPFALGTFTHRNRPITGAISAIDYDLTFQHNGLPAPNPFGLHFDFTHSETPNPTGDPIVTTLAPFSQMFSVGSNLYLFTLLGFSSGAGGPYVYGFTTPENSSQSMTLWANLQDVTPVAEAPEPATLALVGLGLLGGAARLRRRSAARR